MFTRCFFDKSVEQKQITLIFENNTLDYQGFSLDVGKLFAMGSLITKNGYVG